MCATTSASARRSTPGLGVLIAKLEQIGELDNTLLVVSGDHGIPGFPRGKCNLYNLGCEVALTARWPGRVPAGRTVHDFVNLMDLAPTFLEAADVELLPGMAARSLLPVLESPAAGQVDAARDHVVLGRERHVAQARAGNLPYPQRAIRTGRYLYIRNFEPDRWPMGDPRGLHDPSAVPPPYEELCEDTWVAYADMDGSPSKAWMCTTAANRRCRRCSRWASASSRRKSCTTWNAIRTTSTTSPPSRRTPMRASTFPLGLLTVLQEQSDPRVTESDCRFERSPYTDPHTAW